MNPTHYHTGVSGRVRFVTLTGKNKDWTFDGYKANTVDLSPVDELVGREVSLNGNVGKVMQACSDSNSGFLPGKYVGNGKYLPREDLTQYNDCVRVFWYSGVQPVWQPVFKLKFL